ncbi:hypothetical protein E2C01_009021 [Portunus trituberculatus]|uniref:Uncharacterized protein n=1 Tax=Portunus trituberculatus TaxID=210409 RepID=A0A5B7D4C7_PORTR|nr:hypothetical protein [Portunus trituberculatus]
MGLASSHYPMVSAPYPISHQTAREIRPRVGVLENHLAGPDTAHRDFRGGFIGAQCERVSVSVPGKRLISSGEGAEVKFSIIQQPQRGRQEADSPRATSYDTIDGDEGRR